MSLKYYLIVFLIILSESCTYNNPKDINFSWTIQNAGYNPNQFDYQGEISYDKFIEQFMDFPWEEQVESYNEIGEGCSPTLSVQNINDSTNLFVSMMGRNGLYAYLVGYVYSKKEKKFFGLNSKTTKWSEVYITEDTSMVKLCYKMYFNNDYKQLEAKISTLEKFGQGMVR